MWHIWLSWMGFVNWTFILNLKATIERGIILINAQICTKARYVALFGSHAFVKLKVLLHPKLKSHFQRAAILINAHFLYTKNFLLIKGDRRDAWGPFPHV